MLSHEPGQRWFISVEMYTVAIIGGGVIGLSTALAVQKEFGSKAKVIIFADKLGPHTTGDIAAGLWTPYILQNTPEENILKWSKDTYDFILELWQSGLAKDAGISLQVVQVLVNLSNEKHFKIPEWVRKTTLGYSEMSQVQVEEYNKKCGKSFSAGFTFVSFVWEASRFLPLLQEQLLVNGGEMYAKNIQKFDELLQYDIIVNCTGLGALLLVPDPLVQPIRDQVTRVDASGQFHSVMMTDERRAHYVIPNQECVILAATHQEYDFSTESNEKDQTFILDGCARYIPALKHAPLFQHQIGLRPSRNEVRLELENRKIGDKLVKIVHNYGHGDSGVTLSIGCALEASELVKEALGFGGGNKL